MTLPASSLPPNPGVSLRQPQFARTITFTPHATATIVTGTITIGPRVAILRKATVFFPPGVNYSVRLQLGFNGQRMIPTEDADDYIIGANPAREFPWGIQVQQSINYWAWCWNANPHTIQVTLDLDYNPFIPVRVNPPLRMVI